MRDGCFRSIGITCRLNAAIAPVTTATHNTVLHNNISSTPENLNGTRVVLLLGKTSGNQNVALDAPLTEELGITQTAPTVLNVRNQDRMNTTALFVNQGIEQDQCILRELGSLRPASELSATCRRVVAASYHHLD